MERYSKESIRKKASVYSLEFKKNAVQLVLKEGLRQCEVSQNLGIPSKLISRWVKQYQVEGIDAFPGKGHATPSEERVRELEQKLRRVTMERDILKKAIAYFAEPPR